MPEVPECLSRRYTALDELVQELSQHQPQDGCFGDKTKEPGIKLMCDFWNILKEDPDCDLSHAVKHRMGLQETNSCFQQNLACYVTGNSCSGSCSTRNDKRREDISKRLRNASCSAQSSQHSMQSKHYQSPTSKSRQNVPPLTKVLCNLQEAASFEKKCYRRAEELMNNQKVLQDQIQLLEEREKEGVQLLKDADCMWACMEETYKQKIKETFEKHEKLIAELKEVEKSTTKWRKNKKDLEFEMVNIDKYNQEVIEKIAQMNNDTKCMDIEIENLKRKIESNKNIADGLKKTANDKNEASDAKIANIAAQITKQKTLLDEAQQQKQNREEEGQKYIREAREDLQKICRVLLQKKLEKEDLNGEKEGLIEEINLLQQTCDLCREKCKTKQNSIDEEIKSLDKRIADNTRKCIQCHQSVDTSDARRLCSDCPRCKEERECKTDGENCVRDPQMDCVCVTVKEKFLGNIFDNMYSLLEGKLKTPAAKSVADAILQNLQVSQNGKLCPDTRHVIHEFVLNTVKENLDLTIVGGAVKTRCEMDPETYNQLMLCLKQVKIEKPPKEDKGTDVKKSPCHRWGGASECNCPGGSKACPCSKRAPPRPDSEGSKTTYEPENFNRPKLVACPKQSTACGPDCDPSPAPRTVSVEGSSPKSVCDKPTCTFSKNMQAAQCVLGPESLGAVTKNYKPSAERVISDALDKIKCKCGKSSNKTCECKKDIKQLNSKLTKGSATTQLDHLTKNKVEEVVVSQIFPHCIPKERTPCDCIMSDTIIFTDLNETNTDLNSKKYNASKRIKLNNILTQNDLINELLDLTKTFNIVPTNEESNVADKAPIEHKFIKLITNKIYNKLEHVETSRYTIKLEKESGLHKITEAPITKTLSGNVAFDIISLYNDVGMKGKECPVNLMSSNSNAIILNEILDGPSNGVIRKTASGEFLLVLTDNFFQPMNKLKIVKPSVEKYYKVKIKNKDDIIAEPPAVLKSTLSQNYIFVPDKEFETQYNQTIKELLNDSTEYYLNISRTDSDNCVLNVDDMNDNNAPNAIVVKHASGEMKVITRKTNSISKEIKQGKRSVKMTSKVLDEIFHRTPRKRKSSNNSLAQTSSEFSSSELNVYEKSNIMFPGQKSLIADSTRAPEIANSNQYALVLDKESKNSFIKNMNTYFKETCEWVESIDQTDSDGVIINLNNNHNDIRQYGSLNKSGSLYVAVDKEDLKLKSKPSKHMIGKLRHPVNKAVTTTCNAVPTNESCNASECACSNIKYNCKCNNWEVCYETDKFIYFVTPQNHGSKVSGHPDAFYKASGFKEYKESCRSLTSDVTGSSKGLSNIISNPCSYLSVEPNDSYDNHVHVTKKITSKLKICEVVKPKISWDSLNYLPLQLPAFLSDVKYR